MRITMLRSRPQALLASHGGVLAALAVGLLAYASHAVDGPAQARLQTAAMFAFGHGVALAALAPAATRRLAQGALLMLLAGVLLFSGSLVLDVFLQWPTTLAPAGGSLLIAGWLLWAADAARG